MLDDRVYNALVGDRAPENEGGRISASLGDGHGLADLKCGILGLVVRYLPNFYTRWYPRSGRIGCRKPCRFPCRHGSLSPSGCCNSCKFIVCRSDLQKN